MDNVDGIASLQERFVPLVERCASDTHPVEAMGRLAAAILGVALAYIDEADHNQFMDEAIDAYDRSSNPC